MNGARVRQALTESTLLPRGAVLLAAVSGGADSVALLHGLHQASRRNRWTVVAAHLNHGIRGAAAREDADFVQHLCREWGVPCQVGRVRVPQRARQRGLSIEMAAREARYEFLQRAARKAGADIIVTAHHADDQAETVLLRLLRGTGLTGLCGMAQQRPLGTTCLVRPLLSVRRREILAYLQQHHLPWREDAGNQDPVYLRNRIRHELLPCLERAGNPRVRDHFIRLSHFAARDDTTLQTLADAWMQEHLSSRPVVLPVDDLRNLLPGIRSRVLLKWLYQAGLPAASIAEETISALERMLHAKKGTGGLTVGGGLCVYRVYNHLRIGLPQTGQGPEPAPPQVVRRPGVQMLPDLGIQICIARGREIYRSQRTVPGTLPATASFSASRIGRSRLSVRTWRPGDRMAPFGMSGRRKLQDIFTDAKVPPFQRTHIPVLLCRNEIIWIPGYRIARGWDVPSDASWHWQVTLQPLPSK